MNVKLSIPEIVKDKTDFNFESVLDTFIQWRKMLYWLANRNNGLGSGGGGGGTMNGSPLLDVEFYEDGMITTFEDATVQTWLWTKNEDGMIEVLNNITQGRIVNCTWHDVNMP
jgi:hypothetical protein